MYYGLVVDNRICAILKTVCIPLREEPSRLIYFIVFKILASTRHFHRRSFYFAPHGRAMFHDECTNY